MATERDLKPTPESTPESTPADSPPRSVDVVVRLRSLSPSLAPAGSRVADLILRDPAQAARLSIGDMARLASTSETTVTRFAQSLGFAGYPALKIELAAQVARAEGGGERRPAYGSEIDPDDSLEETVRKVAYADASAIEDTANNLDIAALGRSVDAVVAAERLAVFGIGASGFVAGDLASKLNRIGRPCFVWTDVHMAMSSSVLREGDALVCISHSGETPEAHEIVRRAIRGGVSTIAVTNSARSTLAGLAGEVLLTAARETTFRAGAMSSRIAQLSLVDCLFIGVAQRTYTDAVAALGATGRNRPQPSETTEETQE